VPGLPPGMVMTGLPPNDPATLGASPGDCGEGSAYPVGTASGIIIAMASVGSGAGRSRAARG
jgi:hypothetical protein